MTFGRLAKLCSYGLAATAVSVAFAAGIVLPVGVAIVLFFIIATGAGIAARGTPLMLLPRLFITLYALPFAICLVYLVNPENTWQAAPAGVARVYQTDPVLIAEMIAIGTVGLLGLLFGFELARPSNADSEMAESERREPSLPLVFVLIFAVFAVGLSWLGAPTQTIFEAAYASEGTEARSIGLNFAAAFLVSYGLLVALAIDLERERVRTARWWVKSLILVSSIAYVVLYLQLLRGDRESMGLLVGIIAIYLTSGRARVRSDIAWRRVRFLLIPMAVVVTAYVTMGAARRFTTIEPHERNMPDIIEKGFEWNTWTAVLLNNLGAAAEYRYDTIRYLKGQTYLDYVKSLPPGFVAAAVGFERPVDVSRGPGWWYVGLSTGGMHAAVVPFKNFGVVGPFFVLAIFGWFVGRIESRMVNGGYWMRLTYAMTATASFFWFWYGDMNIIRALMIVVIVGVLDRSALLLVSKARSRREDRKPELSVTGS